MAKKRVERETERLHVRIAHSGLCSRRAAETLIDEGRVEVNGEYVREHGIQVGPDDEVRVDGIVVTEAKIYTLVLNKPTGVVTTLHDPQGRPTIERYLPDYGVQLKPVGRLDMDTDGLLIVTNDGELALRLAHPRYGIEKEYQAIVEGIPSDTTLNKLARGVFVEGRKTAPAKIEVVHVEERRQTTSLRLTIHEGRKRQVRLMCLTVGHPVIRLTRVRLGPLHLKGMRPGEVRLLGQKEVEQLRTMVGLTPAADHAPAEKSAGQRAREARRGSAHDRSPANDVWGEPETAKPEPTIPELTVTEPIVPETIVPETSGTGTAEPVGAAQTGTEPEVSAPIVAETPVDETPADAAPVSEATAPVAEAPAAETPVEPSSSDETPSDANEFAHDPLAEIPATDPEPDRAEPL